LFPILEIKTIAKPPIKAEIVIYVIPSIERSPELNNTIKMPRSANKIA
jgi:hypothetical protein